MICSGELGSKQVHLAPFYRHPWMKCAAGTPHGCWGQWLAGRNWGLIGAGTRLYQETPAESFVGAAGRKGTSMRLCGHGILTCAPGGFFCSNTSPALVDNSWRCDFQARGDTVREQTDLPVAKSSVWV